MKVPRETLELMAIILLSWAFLLAFFLGMKGLLYLTEGLAFRTVIRGIGGLFLLTLWALSFFILRNVYARAKGIRTPILPFSSRIFRGRRRA